MTDLAPLLASAVAIAVVHTALGPDHYLPFVAMGRASHWSRARTLLVAAVCGVGHVLSSAVIGLAGVMLGLALFEIDGLDAWRGNVVVWLLIGSGLALCVAGGRSIRAARPHTHVHAHADGTVHAHDHRHETAHVHVHASPKERETGAGGWLLFVVFLFGPCEPLIPILMVPASEGRLAGVLALIAAFGAATVVTMLAAVILVDAAWLRLPRAVARLDTRVAAGVVLISCGLAVGLGL